jgi:inosine/xanthosine triphosphate pyrophosphatase family protein
MTELIFGTNNRAKIAQIQGALKPLDIVVRGIGELGIDMDVPEGGVTAQENARLKGTAYAHAAHRTVFSMDNALYLKGLAEANQPGLNVRRIPGSVIRPTDTEMIAYYTQLLADHGGTMDGYWEVAIAIVSPDGSIAETTFRSPRQFTSTPSKQIVDGYPLESIQIDPETGKYISEMSRDEQDVFWQRVIGRPLMEFVGGHIGLLST